MGGEGSGIWSCFFESSIFSMIVWSHENSTKNQLSRFQSSNQNPPSPNQHIKNRPTFLHWSFNFNWTPEQKIIINLDSIKKSIEKGVVFWKLNNLWWRIIWKWWFAGVLMRFWWGFGWGCHLWMIYSFQFDAKRILTKINAY